MAQTEPTQRAGVVKSDERETHEQLRRIGRAIIALARAQQEADAQAAHERPPDEQEAAATENDENADSGDDHDPSQ